MKPTNGNILKIIGLIFAGITLLGSAVTAHYAAKEDAKNYTDSIAAEITETFTVHAAQDVSSTQEVKDEIAKVHEDVAVIKSIIEYHFAAPKKAK